MEDLVRGFVRLPVPVPPLEWLPLAEVALDEPHRWVEAFAALAVEQQYDLTDRLRADSAGPLAETLLLTLAAHAHGIADEQIRADVLADAAVAADRRKARIDALRERALALASVVDRGTARLREGYDILGEIAALEASLARARARAHEREDDLGRMFDLEHEILRVETRLAVLSGYDEAGRREALAALHAEAEALRDRKATLESELGAATSERDRLHARTGELQAALSSATTQADALRSAITVHTERLPGLHAEAERLRAQAAQLEADTSAVAAEVAALGEQNRGAAETLASERARLRELADAARAASGMEEIMRKIQEVFDLLPDDAADQAL